MNQLVVDRNLDMLPKWHQGGGEQPLSLLTINTNPNNKDDLLTLRILESSERKMQLIKKLLTPEEYNSIARDLFSLDYSIKPEKSVSPVKTISANNNSVPQLEPHQSNRELKKRSSLTESKLILSEETRDLQESLAKKREAIEFFFQNPDNSSAQQTDLAIELRSGYYISPEVDQPKRSKILNEPPFSLLDRIYGLLGLLGISIGGSGEDNGEDDDDEEGTEKESYDQQELEFAHRHKSLNVAPYTNGRNLLAMARRLKNDGQLGKILEREEGKVEGARFTHLVDLAKMHQNHLINTERSLRNLTQMARVVQPVGHFNSIHLVGPKEFNSGLPSAQLLIYSPGVEEFIRMTRRRRCKLPAITQHEMNMTSLVKVLKVNLFHIKLKSHPLMSSEERLAHSLVRLIEKIDRFRESLKTSANQLTEMFAATTLNELKIREKLENHSKQREQLNVLKQELLARSEELETLRKEQKFISSTIAIKPSKDLDYKAEVYELLLKRINAFVENNIEGENQDMVSRCKKYLDEATAETSDMEFIELDELCLEPTPDNKCPTEERARRREIRRWMRMLDLRILIGDRYEYSAQKLPITDLFSLNLSRCQLLVPYTAGQTSVKLQFQLHQRAGFGFIPLPSPLVAYYTCDLSTESVAIQTIDLEFFDDNVRAELKFASAPKLDPNLGDDSRKFQKFIDFLYHEHPFQADHPYEDTGTKVYKLINKVNHSSLLKATMGKEVVRQQFCLNPWVDLFEATDESSKTRRSLLIWRWLNELNHTIYLSEHENIKAFSFQMEEFKSRLKSLPPKQESGYRSIEQTRSLASDLLKEYEQQLLKVLKFEQERRKGQVDSGGGGSNVGKQVEDLLCEPRLKIDFSGAARLAYRLVPRRRARRPLMPQRKTAGRSPLVVEARLDLESQEQLQQTLLGSSELERKLGGHRLQLVVTVQRAANVPMRVLTAPSLSRSASPLPGSLRSPSSPSFLPATIGLANYLLPATTYVEIVFQRRQLASSLAQGKNPTWNETLFFPVETSAHLTSRQSQLVDEFLQLNLYDYHCYTQDTTTTSSSDPMRLESLEPATTMVLNSSLSGQEATQQQSSTSAQRVLATRQRVERHLLGSLRIPLSTLMSTGRIEGSFALNQPLLLDNYQFEPDHFQFEPETQQQQEPPLVKRNPKQTHMSLFITLDPPVAIPPHLYLPTGSHESDQVFEYARQWEQVMSHHRQQQQQQSLAARPSSAASSSRRPSARHRHVRCLVLQRDSRYCLVNRLLAPMAPPQELLEGRSDHQLDQMRSVARFVSLLSPLKHGLLDMRLLAPSLWFNSIQLINQALGGPEEKAVLLCNYFLHLGKCSALLMGDSIQEGRCVYVIVWLGQAKAFEEEDAESQLRVEDLVPHLTEGAFRSSATQITRDNFIAQLPVIINLNSIQIWDPNSGKQYHLNEQLPLLSVGCIATVENVYANTQSTSRVGDTNYDIKLRHLWFPLFDQHSSQGQQPVAAPSDSSRRLKAMNWRRQRLQLEQTRKTIGRPLLEPIFNPNETLVYEKFSQQECDDLKVTIERAVKAQLLKWRPDRPTYFNRTLSRLLADKLALFEGERRLEEPDWRSELADSIRREVLMAHLAPSGLQSRQVISCPINLPYTGMKTILDSIFASGVQNADLILDPSQRQSASSSQFLVACHVHPYPARIVSVWLYVAAIITTTNNNSKNTAFSNLAP